MIYIIIFVILVSAIIYWLYTIGKKVKAHEVVIKKQIIEHKKKIETKRNFLKYSRKNYAKTPTIQK